MMLRALTAASAMAVVAFGPALAQEAPAPTTQRTEASPYGPSSVYANGRCNGISYGTGARRCGSMSGGPSGGISGRN